MLGFQPQQAAVFAVTPELGFPAGLSWLGAFEMPPRLRPFSLVFIAPKEKVDPHRCDAGGVVVCGGRGMLAAS